MGAISQHKRLAMGKSLQANSPGVRQAKFANGGAVKGLPISPVTEAKRKDGIPDMKKGGKACG